MRLFSLKATLKSRSLVSVNFRLNALAYFLIFSLNLFAVWSEKRDHGVSAALQGFGKLAPGAQLVSKFFIHESRVA